MANWFSYNGVGDTALALSYTRMRVKPTCVTGGSIICAIYLDDNSTTSPGSVPQSVLDYISNAQGTLASQPFDGFKRFVYVKSL